MGREPNRRVVLGAFAAGAAGVAVAGLTGCSSDDPSSGDPEAGGGRTVDPIDAPPIDGLTRDPFTLGVASGDPDAGSVVLWTRLAPDPQVVGGAMPVDDAEIVWEVATDDTFDSLVATGTASAAADADHCVHAIADGLPPDTRFHYRFRAGDHTSPVGITRTAPSPEASVDRLVVAAGSCQNWEAGYYTAHKALAAEPELDLVLWLGDYIYEGGVGDSAVRQHNSGEVRTLAEYRARYSLYKTDEDLQAAHAAAPWLTIWDDHEVENNYAGLSPEKKAESAEFPARRAAAYRAWWEYTATRLDPPDGPVLPGYKDLRWGDLAHIFTLDTRQDRADQVCAVFPTVDAGPLCPELVEPDQTIIGEDQEEWLVNGLKLGATRWNLVANQVLISPVPLIGDDLPQDAVDQAAASFGVTDLPPLTGLEGVLADQWDGYPLQRQRIVDAMAEAETPTVVFTGDIHSSAAGPLRERSDDPTSPVVAAEFAGTSITSSNGAFTGLLDAIYEPNFDYYQSSRRGYLRCVVTKDEVNATYLVVDDATVPDSPTSTDARFTFSRDRTFTRT